MVKNNELQEIDPLLLIESEDLRTNLEKLFDSHVIKFDAVFRFGFGLLG